MPPNLHAIYNFSSVSLKIKLNINISHKSRTQKSISSLLIAEK